MTYNAKMNEERRHQAKIRKKASRGGGLDE